MAGLITVQSLVVSVDADWFLMEDSILSRETEKYCGQGNGKLSIGGSFSKLGRVTLVGFATLQRLDLVTKIPQQYAATIP